MCRKLDSLAYNFIADNMRLILTT